MRYTTPVSSNGSLASKTAIVTGASAGIGKQTALSLAANGSDVVVAARSTDRLRAVARRIRDEFGCRAVAVPTDVQEHDQVAALVQTAVEEFDHLDIVVSNAGVGTSGDVLEMTLSEYTNAIKTNVDGTFFLTREALPHLRAADGNLVFVGSFAGLYPYPTDPVYAGSKAWIRQFAHSVEAVAGERGVSVSVINPGGVRTGFGHGGGDDTPTQRDRYGQHEAPEPEEIAETILFACQRSQSASVHEINICRRDQLSSFR